MRTINKELFKSTNFLKIVLFLFLGTSFFQSKAQCPPTSTYISTNSTDAFTNDGQITVSVDAPAVGPFDYYLTDINSNIIQSVIGEVSNVYTFLNISSGFYRVNINNTNCATAGFNTLDSVYVYPNIGGDLTYTGAMGYCGGSGATITANFNSCSTPSSPFSNNFELFDNTGTSIFTISTISDSVVLPTLIAGDYILTVTNTENNCTAIDTFTISSNTLLSSISSTNVSSSGGSDGSFTLNITNGISPYTLYYVPSFGSAVNISFNQSDTTISNLNEGTYIIYLYDGSGCQSVADTIEILYNSCLSTLIQPLSCDPAIVLSATTSNLLSGNFSYTYELSYEGTVIETLNSALDSITFTTLVSDSGSYSLQVINDSTSCSSTDMLVVDLNIMSVNVLALNDISSQGACDGFISLEVLGGTFPYSITWTDGSGSVISGPTAPFNTSSLATLCEDTYCIEVTDASPCTITECFDIMFTPCNVTLSVTDSIDCFNGSGQISATIDTLPVPPGPIAFTDRYTFTLYSLNPTTQIGLPISTNNLSNSWNGLFEGDYLVDVIDNSYGTSCTSDSISLTQPNPINIYLTTDSTSAPWNLDGSITIDSITGGTSPYSFQWIDSVGNPFSTSSTSVTGLGYSNQYNGGYTLLVTDTNGCIEQSTVYIHPENSGVNLAFDSVGVQDASCFGVCDGKLYWLPLNVGPGSVPPFTYIWRDDAGNIMRVDSLGSSQYNGAPSHVATYTNRCAGQYTIEVFDYYGNSLPPYLFTIAEPDVMTVDLGPDIIMDCGEDTVLVANPSGGNLTSDTTLINSFVLDFNNPSGIGDTLITGQDYILVISGTLTDGFGNTYDAFYDYTLAPNVTPSVLWNMDGQNNATPTPNSYNTSHQYVYQFTGQAFGNITGSSIHTWSIPSSNYTGQLNFDLYQVDNFINSYNYVWTTNPLTFPSVVSNEDTCIGYPGVNGTDYIVTVEDINGCTASDTIGLSWDLYILEFDQINITNVLPCYGNSTGSISVTVDSNYGYGPYVYSDPIIGTNGALTYTNVNDTTFGLPAGDYIFCLQDSLGCLSYDTIVSITQPDSIWACGIGNTNVQFQIDNFVMDIGTINAPFNYTSTIPTLIGVNYKLIVEGTYGLEFFNSNHKDAAFITTTGNPVNDWTMDGLAIRPDIDVYNPTHRYEYTFLGDGNAKYFDFSDNNYSDNAGSLTFTLYKLGCSSTDTVYTCSGDSTASASISATGGVPFDLDGILNSGDEFYNFYWEDASGTNWTNYSVTNGVSSTISGIPTGFYTVTIEDANGCLEYERYVRVLEATAPLVLDSTEVLNVLCFGAETAQVKAYFSGGYGPYYTVLTHVNGGVIDTVYQSINDIDSVVIDSLIFGSYSLYIYDSIPNSLNGDYFCPQLFQFNIDQPQSPMSSSISLLTHVSCWGDSTGAAKVIASGGQSQLPYTYLWDNGETTATADSLWADVNVSWPSPQWQGVTITDSNGCSIRDSIQIEHLNEEIQAFNTADGSNTVQVIQDVQCFNACDAIATVSSVGGVLPHSYSWDIGQIGNFMPDTAINLCYGGHDIIIEDQVGCRKTVYYQISQPDELFANAQWVDMIDCFGYDNGIAHGTATGGTLPYTFVWDSLTGQMNDTAYNLTPGIHTVIVTDAKGCMATDTVTITEPTELTIAIQDTSTVYSYCTGTNSAQLYAIASGGIEPYNYVWSDVLGQTTQLADDLMAGIYTVTVLDDRGCSASDTRNIDSVTNSMDATTSVTNVSCFGLFDGSTFVDNVIGAVPINNNPLTDPNPPYVFNWTGPNGYTANQNQINFLYAGNYGVTITDSNNCSITIYTNVQEPDQLEYTLYNVNGSTCYGACNGSISVNVEGGTSPYYWDGDQLGNFPFTNSISLISDSMILDLCTDDYDIYVTDDNDCVGTVLWGGVWQATIDSGIVVTIDPPNVTQAATCFNSNDGHANVIFPINTNFTYTWETLGGVIVDTGAYTTILGGGDYNLVAHYSDSASFGQVYSGCDASVIFNMPSAPQILPNELITPISCYGDSDGTITLNVSGGTGSYTYQWDTTVSVPNGSTNSFVTGLQEGTYTVTITDNMGCTETIDYDLIEPEAITNNFSNYIEVACNGQNNGSITANPSGGTPNYSYSWSPSGGNGQTANNLTAGDYIVTITDSRSCIESFEVTITEPEAIISGVEPNAFYGNDPTGTISYNISCNGFSDGAAIVNLGGGTSPFTYSWTTGGSSQMENNMPAGTHSVTVTDINNCSETMSVTLVEPDALVVNGSTTGDYNPFPGGFDITCKGLNDGECYADPYGGVPGTPGYMYSWSGPINGQISNLDQIVNLYVGTYSVTVTDANGCNDIQTFTLTEPTEEFLSITHMINYAGASEAPVLAGFQDATVSVDPYDYTFYWPVPIGDSTFETNVTNGQIFPDHSFDVIGENEVYIKVQNMNSGCLDDTTFVIEVQGIPEIHNVFTPNGDGSNDYFSFEEYAMTSVEALIYNRWGELVYSWSSPNQNWDGRGIDGEELPEGVYYYVLNAIGEDGYSYTKKGSITLLR